MGHASSENVRGDRVLLGALENLPLRPSLHNRFAAMDLP